MRFRTRVIEVEAEQFTGDNIDALTAWLSEKNPSATIIAHERPAETEVEYKIGPDRFSLMSLMPGHWIVWDGRQPWCTSDIGLRGHYDRVEPYDRGGMLPPGVSTVYNGTGRPEPVEDPDGD